MMLFHFTDFCVDLHLVGIEGVEGGRCVLDELLSSFSSRRNRGWRRPCVACLISLEVSFKHLEEGRRRRGRV